MPKKFNVVVVTGPTATGKTALAVELARRWNGEVISADSRQVYQHLDIGSGKDLQEYGEIPYHLIDIVPPGGSYHLKQFTVDARNAIRDIDARGKLPVICGGSALYIHALLKNYTLPGEAPDEEERRIIDATPLAELQKELQRLDPEFYASFANRDNFNRVRRAVEIRRRPSPGEVPDMELNALVLGVLFPRRVVHERIEARLDARLNVGLIEEVADLHDKYGMSWDALEFLGLEYRCVAEYLQGRCEYEEMRFKLLCQIRQFAKRQDIFFRKMEREGIDIYWLPEGDRGAADRLIAAFVNGKELPEPEFRLKDFINSGVRVRKR